VRSRSAGSPFLVMHTWCRPSRLEYGSRALSRFAKQLRAELFFQFSIFARETSQLTNFCLLEHISRRSVAMPRRRSSAMVGARSMELLLRQQKSTGVLETNSPPLMPALPLLTSHPSLAHSVSGAVESRAEKTHHRNMSKRAKVKEECDGKIKEYEVAT